jgi:hypothetical protein
MRFYHHDLLTFLLQFSSALSNLKLEFIIWVKLMFPIIPTYEILRNLLGPIVMKTYLIWEKSQKNLEVDHSDQVCFLIF